MDGGNAMEVFTSFALTSLLAVAGLSFDVPAIAPAHAVAQPAAVPQLPAIASLQLSLMLRRLYLHHFRET